MGLAPQPESLTAPRMVAVSPTRPYWLCHIPPPNSLTNAQPTWYSANNAANLIARTRPDQIAEPTNNSTTGEYVFEPEGSVLLTKFLIRGAGGAISRGNTITAQLWEWSLTGRQDGVRFTWTPTLVGRWTILFNGTGVAGNNTVGVAGTDILDTDLYASNIVVVATYDRRGDYALRWKILQPAADDGSPAILMVDGLGSNKFSWEGRTTTNGDMFQFTNRWTSGNS